MVKILCPLCEGEPTNIYFYDGGSRICSKCGQYFHLCSWTGKTDPNTHAPGDCLLDKKNKIEIKQKNKICPCGQLATGITANDGGSDLCKNGHLFHLCSITDKMEFSSKHSPSSCSSYKTNNKPVKTQSLSNNLYGSNINYDFENKKESFNSFDNLEDIF